LFELVDGTPLFAAKPPDGIFKANIQVILDQLLLGLGYGFFNGVKLLRDIEACAAGLDHTRNTAKMTFGPLQALDDIGTGVMILVL